MLQYERDLWNEGFVNIAGVDEVGRGCLFGDVVAGAVILPPGLIIEGVDDSKKLSEKKRNQLYDQIADQALAWSVARVDASVIDKINIKQAARLAMKLAVESLSHSCDFLLIDAEKVDIALPQKSIIKGDANSQSIAAASIMAKVTRDRLCEGEWETAYPQYGIAIHKGYATKLHRERLLEHGPSELHRRTFLRKLLGDEAALETQGQEVAWTEAKEA
jgi:ribonuclease HII